MISMVQHQQYMQVQHARRPSPDEIDELPADSRDSALAARAESTLGTIDEVLAES